MPSRGHRSLPACRHRLVEWPSAGQSRWTCAVRVKSSARLVTDVEVGVAVEQQHGGDGVTQLVQQVRQESRKKMTTAAATTKIVML